LVSSRQDITFQSSAAAIKGDLLAKPNYQFEKRQKELAKKNKKEEKRQKKVAENTATDDVDRKDVELSEVVPPATQTEAG
jgi:hypothetical protein